MGDGWGGQRWGGGFPKVKWPVSGLWCKRLCVDRLLTDRGCIRFLEPLLQRATDKVALPQKCVLPGGGKPEIKLSAGAALSPELLGKTLPRLVWSLLFAANPWRCFAYRYTTQCVPIGCPLLAPYSSYKDRSHAGFNAHSTPIRLRLHFQLSASVKTVST